MFVKALKEMLSNRTNLLTGYPLTFPLKYPVTWIILRECPIFTIELHLPFTETFTILTLIYCSR